MSWCFREVYNGLKRDIHCIDFKAKYILKMKNKIDMASAYYCN